MALSIFSAFLRVNPSKWLNYDRNKMADSGYSWVVLAATFLLNMHRSGGLATVGIFLLEFMEHFDAPKSAVTSISGLFLCVGYLFGFLIGSLCRAYGCRPLAMVAGLLTSGSLILSSFASSIVVLYFTYGCLASIGFCSFFTTATIAVQQAFDKRRAFASGIALSGVSVGVIVWPPFTRWAIDEYGWRGALILLAGVHLHSLVFAMLLRPVHVSAIDHITNKRDSDGQLKLSKPEKRRARFMNQFRNLTSPIRGHPAFCAYLVGVLLIQTGHVIPYSFIPTRAKAMNIEQTLAAMLVSAIGLTSGVSRPACGYIGDHRWVNRTLMSGLSGVVAGMLTAFSFFLTSYIQMTIYSGLYGLVIGAHFVLLGATVVDLVGLDSAAPGIGYVNTAMGLGQLIALTVSGKLLDQFKDPAYTFLVFGVVQALGGIILIMTMVVKRCYKITEDNQPLPPDSKPSE